MFSKKILSLGLLAALILIQIPVAAQVAEPEPPPFPDLSKGRGLGSKGGPTDKLSPELKILLSQYAGSKGRGPGKMGVSFSARQLREVFGIDAGEKAPTVSVAVAVRSEAETAALRKAGMKVYLRHNGKLYGELPVGSLGRLAASRDVLTVAAVKGLRAPVVPRSPVPPALPAGSKGGPSGGEKTPLANEFDRSSLTGKGTIVGVIDSGIDFRHPDFINPDGTSRIIAIWDMYDNSWEDSEGKIGTAPPRLDPDGDPLWGTVYTNAQLTAALRNGGEVNTDDFHGHGTASAGTAAGNGRASDGQFAGIAPEADLIVMRAGECGGIDRAYLYGAYWMVRTAAELDRPIVINQSFGGHFTAHDGTEEEEELLDSLSGPGIPGVVFTVSAGNEGRYSFHATGRFGKRTDRGNEWSRAVSLTIGAEETRGADSLILGYFDARDDWGVVIDAKSTTGLIDADGRPLSFYVFKAGGEIRYLLPDTLTKPDWFDAFAMSVLWASRLGTEKDQLALRLPPGSYNIFAFGTSEKVVNGEFDLYAPFYYQAEFGKGTTRTGMVGSPGNAANVITVGAYNFRNSWTNHLNALTSFNLPLGEISDYSSPGGTRRSDGVVKPDIVAPATYTISPLAGSARLDSTSCEGAHMGSSGENFVTADEKYVAWQGTSASAPFAAGVIALMLEKNPTLDAARVREILKKTARRGGVIGAVPNPVWGYGMLDPVRAIRETPPPGRSAAR